jgi:hypothetical protein
MVRSRLEQIEKLGAVPTIREAFLKKFGELDEGQNFGLSHALIPLVQKPDMQGKILEIKADILNAIDSSTSFQKALDKTFQIIETAEVGAIKTPKSR